MSVASIRTGEAEAMAQARVSQIQAGITLAQQAAGAAVALAQLVAGESKGLRQRRRKRAILG